jgi:hypothetical protein
MPRLAPHTTTRRPVKSKAMMIVFPLECDTPSHDRPARRNAQVGPPKSGETAFEKPVLAK